MKTIAYIKNDFNEKFGIPRQSGLVNTRGKVIFEKEFRVKEAFSGLEEFSHIWLVWKFSKAERDTWSPTVRPPLLGGNKRKGVFATRSPYRPNSIGLSCVKLEKIEYTKENGPVLHVLGADLLDGTPILDIKPYLPYADSIPDAFAGFTETLEERKLNVIIKDESFYELGVKTQKEIIELLSLDPRPSYKGDGEEYGMRYADCEIKFQVEDKILSVISVEKV